MAKRQNPWLVLVKTSYAQVKKEGKLKGAAMMKEAISRAKKAYKKKKA